MPPRSVPCSALAAAVGLLCFACSPGAEDRPAAPKLQNRRPNLVIYLIDTLRADHTSLYGYGRPTTPRMEALALESWVFDQARSQAPWTLPSTVSLFTSTYPSTHGVLSGVHTLDRSVMTFVEFIKEHGYHTMGFVTNGLGGRNAGLAEGYDAFYQLPPVESGPAFAKERPLYDILEAFDGEAPFFLYVHQLEPHDPYLAVNNTTWHPVDADRVEQLNQDCSRFGGVLRRRERGEPAPGDPALAGPLAEFESRGVFDVASLYDGDVLEADRDLGRLIDYLKARGEWEDTVFVLVADHGEEFLEHGHLGHGQSLYDELVRVPMVIRIPGQAGAARRSQEPVQLIDIAPTLAEILGVEPLDFWEGRSLWPLIEGGGLGLRGSLSMREEVDRPMKGRRGDRETALVLDGWKLIAHHETSRYSLFNLSVDPAEAHDLSSEQPVRLAALRKELEQRLAKLVRLPMRAQEEQMSDETFLQMQVLGYIDRDQQPPARTEPSDN